MANPVIPAELPAQLPWWAQMAFVILDKYGLATLMAVILVIGLIVIIWKWHSKINENLELQRIILERIATKLNISEEA